MVLEPCLELAQPVNHPGKRKSQQETAGNLGSWALKPWGVGIACPALGGQHCPAAAHRTELASRVSFPNQGASRWVLPVLPSKYF